MIELFRRMVFLPAGASTVADGVDALHAFVILVTLIMSTYVFGAATWFTIRYARKSERQLTLRQTATRTHEAFIVAGVLGTFLSWWVLGFRQYIHMAEAPRGAAVVYVEAKQWMWKFSYPDGRATNDVLTIPIGRPITLAMTSRDVIHSFYVPSFRVKQDVLPGRYTTVWFEATKTGTFPIWCAEYCGVSHSLMRGEVVVLSQEDYAAWQRSGKGQPVQIDCGGGPASCGGADLVEIGRQVATRRACVACHTLDGQRHVGPTWSGLYGSERTLADGRKVIADEAYLTRSMMEPMVDVVAGYAQVMPTYQGTLTSAETGALVELIRSLRDGPAAPSGVNLPRLEITTTAVTAGDGGLPSTDHARAP